MATNWTVQHSVCTIAPKTGIEIPASDYFQLINPNAQTISTGDTVTVRFDLEPALLIHSSLVTDVGYGIRLTDPKWDTSGGDPTVAETIMLTGTNIQNAATTFAGTDNYQGDPIYYTPVIDYQVGGAPRLLIPVLTKDAVINSMSVTFTAPGGGSGNPDFFKTCTKSHTIFC